MTHGEHRSQPTAPASATEPLDFALKPKCSAQLQASFAQPLQPKSPTSTIGPQSPATLGEPHEHATHARSARHAKAANPHQRDRHSSDRHRPYSTLWIPTLLDTHASGNPKSLPRRLEASRQVHFIRNAPPMHFPEAQNETRRSRSTTAEAMRLLRQNQAGKTQVLRDICHR